MTPLDPPDLLALHFLWVYLKKCSDTIHREERRVDGQQQRERSAVSVLESMLRIQVARLVQTGSITVLVGKERRRLSA